MGIAHDGREEESAPVVVTRGRPDQVHELFARWRFGLPGVAFDDYGRNLWHTLIKLWLLLGCLDERSGVSGGSFSSSFFGIPNLLALWVVGQLASMGGSKRCINFGLNLMPS